MLKISESATAAVIARFLKESEHVASDVAARFGGG